MKKTAIMMLLLVSIITVSGQVPDNIRTTFEKKNPYTNATWKTESGIYSAYFNDEEKNQRVISYDQNGEMISNSFLINRPDVPANITIYFNNNYPTQTNYKVWMEDMNGTNSYYTINGTNKFYFDSNGNYLRSGTVTDNNPDKNMKSNTQQDRQNQSSPPPSPVPNPDNPK